MRNPLGRRLSASAGATLTAGALFAAATVPAAAMTVTFIRHAESQGNASGVIDTSIPGPHLTNDVVNPNGGPTGEQQAQAFADNCNPCTYDAIYYSTMIRTKETAAPLADKLSIDPVELGTFDVNRPARNSGVQEIDAGIFEGLPESEGLGRIGYIIAPMMWSLGLQFVPIPGGENGLEFNERVTNSLEDVEADGAENPAIFSHGATIMFWTMMNVDNPNLLLIAQHPLSNTETVVVEKNADGSWTLKEWAGEEVGPANYPTQMFVNFRDLIVAPQKAVYDMRIPVLTPDPAGILTTGAQGVQNVAQASVKFVQDSVTDTINAITGLAGGGSPLSVPMSAKAGGSSTAPSLTDTPNNLVKGAKEQLASLSEQVSQSVNGAVKLPKSLTNGDKPALKAPDLKKVADQVTSRVETTVKEARDTVKKAVNNVKDAA